MKTTHNSSTQNQAKMIQGAVDRCRDKEADELDFYVALKRGTKIAQTPSPISTVVITPVGYRCNLSCDYCFNKPEDGNSYPLEIIPDEVLDRIIQEVISVSKNIEFIWHGGEPLLAGIDFYQKVLAVQQKYDLPTTKARNAIQTNGTLLNESWAAFFKEHDFKVGFSLDGPENIHNTHRKYPSKQGAFQDVMQAIYTLNDCKKSFGLVAILTEKNLCSPEKFLDFFICNKLFQLGVNPCLNGPNLATQTYADFMCRLFDAWLTSDVPELQINFFEGLIQAFLGLPHNICWLNGNCPRIIRVDQAGDVWPCCDRYLPFEQYKFGNIQHNSLPEILAGAVYSKFQDVFGKLSARCVECEWSHICKGGCAYHRLINGQGKDGGDPLCEAYKQIFRHVFKKCRAIYGQP